MYECFYCKVIFSIKYFVLNHSSQRVVHYDLVNLFPIFFFLKPGKGRVLLIKYHQVLGFVFTISIFWRSCFISSFVSVGTRSVCKNLWCVFHDLHFVFSLWPEEVLILYTSILNFSLFRSVSWFSFLNSTYIDCYLKQTNKRLIYCLIWLVITFLLDQNFTPFPNLSVKCFLLDIYRLFQYFSTSRNNPFYSDLFLFRYYSIVTCGRSHWREHRTVTVFNPIPNWPWVRSYRTHIS